MNGAKAAMIGLAVAVVLVATVAPRVEAQEPSFVDVVFRLGTYLTRYEEQLSSVIADERYEQRYESRSFGRRLSSDRRSLESEFLFLRTPGDEHWLGVRSALRVDGTAIGTAADRLSSRLAREANTIDEARRIAAENARYNLGDVPRTINVPTHTLELLAAKHRSRFTFVRGGEERINGQPTRRINFDEQTRPTLIRTAQGADQRARGSVWVDPADGRVFKTELHLGDDNRDEDYVRTTITVVYDRAASLPLLVPIEMTESYNRRAQSDGLSYQLSGRARYTNFRRFEVGARVVN